MNWKHVVATCAGIALLLLLAIGLREYITERENRARAEEREKAADERNAVIKQQMQERDVAYQQSLAQLQAKRKSVVTPQQAANEIPKIVQLPEQPHEITKEDTLPDAPSHFEEGAVVFPKADMKPLFDRLNECQQTELSLTKCTADLKDTTQIAADNDAKAKAWEKAAKGGGWITRSLKKAKVIVCAGAGAGLGAAANQGPKGAAVGALAGATVCSLF